MNDKIDPTPASNSVVLLSSSTPLLCSLRLPCTHSKTDVRQDTPLPRRPGCRRLRSVDRWLTHRHSWLLRELQPSALCRGSLHALPIRNRADKAIEQDSVFNAGGTGYVSTAACVAACRADEFQECIGCITSQAGASYRMYYVQRVIEGNGRGGFFTNPGQLFNGRVGSDPQQRSTTTVWLFKVSTHEVNSQRCFADRL